jgi:hypothetical protein
VLFEREHAALGLLKVLLVQAMAAEEGPDTAVEQAHVPGHVHVAHAV